MASNESDETNVGCFKAMARKLSSGALEPSCRGGVDFHHEGRRPTNSRRRSLDERIWGIHKTHPAEGQITFEMSARRPPGHRISSSFGDPKLPIEIEDKLRHLPSPSSPSLQPCSPSLASSLEEASPLSSLSSSSRQQNFTTDSSSGDDLGRESKGGSKLWKEETPENSHGSSPEEAVHRWEKPSHRNDVQKKLSEVEYKIELSEFDRYGIDIDLFVGNSRLPPIDVMRHAGLLQPVSGSVLSAMAVARESTETAERDEFSAAEEGGGRETQFYQQQQGGMFPWSDSKESPLVSDSSDRFSSPLARSLSIAEIGKEGPLSPLVRSWSLSGNTKWKASSGEPGSPAQIGQRGSPFGRTPGGMDRDNRPLDSPKKTKKGVVKSLRRWLSGPVDLGPELERREL